MTPITRDLYREQIQLSPARGLLHKTDSAITLRKKTFFLIKKSMRDRERIYAKLVALSIENKHLISSTRDHSAKNLPLKLNIGREA